MLFLTHCCLICTFLFQIYQQNIDGTIRPGYERPTFIYSITNPRITTTTSTPKSIRQPGQEVVSESTACYKTITEDGLHIAITPNETFTNPPPYLVIHVHFRLIKRYKNIVDIETEYYLKLVNYTCNKTFEFSNMDKSFEKMKIRFDFYVGYKGYLMTSANITIYPNFAEGTYRFKDAYGTLEIYGVYKKCMDQYIDETSDVSYDLFNSLLERKFYNKPFICVAREHYRYVIKPYWIGTVPVLPFYYSLVLRSYYDGSQDSVMEFAAWGCDGQRPGIENTRKFYYYYNESKETPPVMGYTFNEISEDREDISLKQLEEFYTVLHFVIPGEYLFNIFWEHDVNDNRFIYAGPIEKYFHMCPDKSRVLFIQARQKNIPHIILTFRRSHYRTQPGLTTFRIQFEANPKSCKHTWDRDVFMGDDDIFEDEDDDFFY